jgi:hypothetical protein
MGLPRIQISLRKGLFFVGVVALNCAAYRALYQMLEAEPNAEPLSLVSSKAALGALPLLNVALIGASIYLARRIQSRRRGCEANSRLRPAAMTYFSLHFLALGFVVITLMPELTKVYLETLSPGDGYDWKAVVDRYPSACSGFSIKCLILAVLVSGLPLLLSWIGHRLAARCAARLSPLRFGIMTCLISLGFAIVAMTIWLKPRPFAEERDVEFVLQIVDNDSGQALGAAVVRMTDPFDKYWRPMRIVADAAGRVQLTDHFQAVGERIAWRTIGLFLLWGRWLEVSGPEYQTMQLPLSEVLGAQVSLEGPCIQKVRLIKGKSPENPFRDLAGSFSSMTGRCGGGSSLEIEPDGRFIFTGTSSCTERVHEFGYLKRKDREIQLIPAARPGQAHHPWLPLNLQVIPQDNRLFLSSTDDETLRTFSAAVLDPQLGTTVLEPGIYQRDSDRRKP